METWGRRAQAVRGRRRRGAGGWEEDAPRAARSPRANCYVTIDSPGAPLDHVNIFVIVRRSSAALGAGPRRVAQRHPVGRVASVGRAAQLNASSGSLLSRRRRRRRRSVGGGGRLRRGRRRQSETKLLDIYIIIVIVITRAASPSRADRVGVVLPAPFESRFGPSSGQLRGRPEGKKCRRRNVRWGRAKSGPKTDHCVACWRRPRAARRAARS